MSNLSKQGKLAKAFTAMTSFATVLSMSGVMYLAPTALAVTPSDYGLKEGDVVSAAGSDDPDVYIVNELGYKRLFLNPAIFNFYGHLGGFAAVKNVSAATRDAFGTSGLFRNCETNDPKVYGVETTGEDTGMLHWVNTTGAQAVMDDANFFKKVFCINNNEFNWYSKGSDYTSVNQVPNYTRGTTVTAGPVSVGLASSNPVSGSIVDGQARYNLASFMFSGNTSVVSVKLKRVGVSADASLTNVYLYDGNTRLTDSATVSDGVIFFNDAGGLFSLSGSKVISVLADIDGSSGETIGVQVTEVNGLALGPVSGNLHTIATATLATVAAAALTTPSDGTNDGIDNTGVATDPADDVVAWQDTVTVGQRYVWLKSLQLRVVGSVAVSDVQNFRLYLDGVQVGSAVSQRDSNGYIVFDMSSNPVKMETGGRVLKVLANIIGGSSKDFHLSLRQKSDIWAVDSQYGAAVLATGTFPVGDVDNELEISSGTLTVTKKTDSPSGDVVKGASGVVLGRYEFKAAGEKMKVENLRINNTTGSGVLLALRNAALFADGVQVGSTTTLWEDSSPAASSSNTYAEVSLGSSLIVTPGTPRIVEIRADIFDASGTDNTALNQTFTANIDTGSSNVQRMTTLDYVNGPTGVKAANQLTIKTGSFTAGKYTGYANQSVVTPKNAVKIGHFTLAAASSEDVNVNTLVFEITEAVAASLSSDFTDGYAKVWNDSGSVVYTSPIKATLVATTAALAAASNSYSVNFTIPKNKTYQVELWANAASTFDVTPAAVPDTASVKFKATGTTVGSSTSVTATQVVGQTITSAAGSLTKANGAFPAARLFQGGMTGTGYQFTLTPAYDDFTLDEVYVDIASTSAVLLASSSNAVSSMVLKDGSTTLASAVLNSVGSASFTGLNYPLTQAGGTKTFTVDVVYSSVGVGSNDTAGKVTVRLDGLKYRNGAGSITTENGYVQSSFGGNATYVVKGYPTFTNVALPTTVLSAGTQTIFKTSLGAVGAQVTWNQIQFSVASNSTAGTFNNFKLYENGVDITPFATGAVASTSSGTTSQNVEFRFATERVVTSGSSVTLELRVDVAGTLGATDNVTTSIANGSGSTVTAQDSATQQALGTNNFTWSDGSSAAHSTSTADWFTDGLVMTLGQSQSLNK